MLNFIQTKTEMNLNTGISLTSLLEKGDGNKIYWRKTGVLHGSLDFPQRICILNVNGAIQGHLSLLILTILTAGNFRGILRLPGQSVCVKDLRLPGVSEIDAWKYSTYNYMYVCVHVYMRHGVETLYSLGQ